MAQALSINRLVNVTVNLAPRAAQMQNISTLLILGTSNIIDMSERYRVYNGIDEVAADFGTTAPEYLAALLWFEQSPQPGELLIGRWAKTATSALLVGAPLSTADMAMTVWNPIVDGSFKININGADYSITALDFSLAANMNGVASVIQTGLAAALAGTTCVWNDTARTLVISSPTTGVASTISFATTAGAGTDISELMAMTATSSGARIVVGFDAETPVEAVAEFDNQFGQVWYAVTVLDTLDHDELLDVSSFVEASANKHFHGISTQEGGVLSTVSTTDIASKAKAAGYKKTTVQYSSSTPYAVCSLLGRILPTNYNGNNTVITLMYKQEPGIVPENLTATQANAIAAKNCNAFVAYNNDTAIVQNGTVANGDFVDTVLGTDWLALAIQNVLFNLLYTSTTKIPQTDAGNNILATGIASVCAQGVINGLLAPGVWNSGGFGSLNQGDFLEKGYYIYAPPISSQLQADREARKSVVFQVAAKLAGAIHTVDVIVNVNR